jgi:hypothetical protein
MKPARTLIRIEHGSHLYGTNTETSDRDYKGVFLPAGRDILLNRIPSVIDKGTGVQNEKNTKDDIDDQSFNIQKFIAMVSSGDTVGTEILFAPEASILHRDPLWDMVMLHKDYMINKQCKGFVGYCQRQAAKYGIKGSRMAACKGIVELLDSKLATHGYGAKLAEIGEELNEFCATHEFAEMVPVNQQSGVALYHLDVVDRKVPVSGTIKQAFDIYSKVFANYGDRTRAAMDNKGIDWKAVSHAIRVAGQAKELLSTGHITFPRPDAPFLLEVKQGKHDYNDIAPLLERMVEEVDEASRASSLPGKSNNVALDELVLVMHASQISY